METWLSPFCSVWKAQFPDGVIPFKQLAQALKPLLKVHSPERIVSELQSYLRYTPIQFQNLRKFTATFGMWTELGKPKSAPRPYSQTADQADRAAGIPIP